MKVSLDGWKANVFAVVTLYCYIFTVTAFASYLWAAIA